MPSLDPLRERFRPVSASVPEVMIEAVSLGLYDEFGTISRGDAARLAFLLCELRLPTGKSALHMVSAWGCEQRLVLAQIATDAKSNEITAVPKLLKMLSLKGTIVTTDALNCQRATTQQIIDQEGDHVLALKGNQGNLLDDVSRFLDDLACDATNTDRTVDADHGRIETRTATVSADIAWLQEDQDRSRLGNSPNNLAILRHMALNVMQKENVTKGSLRGKFKRAGWDNAYLASLLALF